MDTRVNPVRERIESVRQAMNHAGVQALLVPSADPHLSEYLPERWAGREWLSGFTGSMATLVVLHDKAALFADSRYWEQAERQLLGSGIDLVRIPSTAASHHVEWIVLHLTAGASLAVDGQVLGLAAAQQLRAALTAAGLKLITTPDLLERAWPKRPAPPSAPIFAHEPPHASSPRSHRLVQLRQAMAGHGASHHFVSTVDDIAWITNLRGADVAYNPVFLAHLLIDASSATLFVGAGKVSAALARQLSTDGFTVADYAQAGPALAALAAGSSLLIDPRRITLGFAQQVSEAVKVVEATNPSTLAKSRKGATEVEFIREAMAQDGAAMCAFYADFEAVLARGERISELDVDARLSAERAKRRGFMGLSFSTIAGFNANGALPHYRAMPDAFSWIEGNGLLLIDSGGQYLGGTTDITRVWPIGTVSAAQKRDYTLVLKGTMALSRIRFPRGTLSPMLDAIARAPLWQHGLDYGHGTGHGVGYFLNVHEGPQSLSKAVPEPQMAMEPGMVTSIEPGLYRPGQWGIRIENLVVNRAVETAEGGVFGDFLEFETLTLCPIDTRCIDMSLMRADEVDWLNGYHAVVRARLAPLVEGDALGWLNVRTEAMSKCAGIV